MKNFPAKPDRSGSELAHEDRQRDRFETGAKLNFFDNRMNLCGSELAHEDRQRDRFETGAKLNFFD
ncbi:hypothetical protein, partial [Pseudomonas bohemica]|uniref:hypothetical protein n=1 Tax=Pseudomonas bohemica TaxID=2044872 RepID=UPI001F3BD879